MSDWVNVYNYTGNVMEEGKKLSSEQLAALREQIRSGIKNEELKAQAAAEAFVSAPESSKRIDVSISDDRMKATMYLYDPGEEAYTVPELINVLRSKRIVIGIKAEALMDAVNNRIYDKEIEVAVGKELVPSQEGYYDFFFDTEEHRRPVVREDGTTDYGAVGRLANVNAGDRIALYHPATLGESGYDITGVEKVAKPSKEKPQLRGQFIRFDENTKEYFATKSGKISLRDSNVEILDVHEINDNVTLIQGKVEFFGDLYIHGDVENGVTIRAGRNIVIDGTVGAANISAGGDIILQKGIQGAGKGKVSARGNIFSDFIEYAKVEAGMDVYANSIINSDVSTQGSVIVSGSHGSIIGGDTYGLKGITTNEAGSASEVKTTLNAGFKEEEYEKYLDLVNKEKTVSSKLDNVVDEITVLFKASAKAHAITKAQKSAILLLNEKKIVFQNEIEQIKEAKADISSKMARGMGAAIIVRGDVFRNVIIKIDTATQYIWKAEAFVKYICKNQIIERKTVPREM